MGRLVAIPLRQPVIERCRFGQSVELSAGRRLQARDARALERILLSASRRLRRDGPLSRTRPHLLRARASSRYRELGEISCKSTVAGPVHLPVALRQQHRLTLMDGDLRRADLHPERHPRVPFATTTERSLLARPVPRRSIGLPAIGLKQHRHGRRRDQPRSATTNRASVGWPEAPSGILRASAAEGQI